MKSYLVLLALVGFTYSSTSPAWKANTEYVYLVNGRTLTSLHELLDQYSGIFLKAKLYISPRSDGKLQARISDAQYAQIHSKLPDGWNTKISDSQLTYKELGLSDKPFLIIMENGLIKGLVVEKEMANWESNIIKSIVSQFQLDIQGKNAIYSPVNVLPKNDKLEGIFKTMEETITGETETFYEIHRFPEYLMQTQPWLVPQPKLKGDGEIIEVIKNKNYSNTDQIPAYHYGFGQITKGGPASNKMGDFFLRQSTSRVLLTGKLSRFTVQNAQTSNKIIINPTLDAKEQGSVISTINVTLFEVKSQSEQLPELTNPVEIGNLVYTYEIPFGESNKAHKKQQSQPLMQESSEETLERSWQRFRRSADQMTEEMQQRSSFKKMKHYQPRPVMTQVPEFPLLPYYMGYYGRSIKLHSDYDIEKNVQKIAKEISEELPNPEQILVRSTLSKYSMLCSLVRLMNEEEIKSVAHELYTQSKKDQKRFAWVSFRDAIAEAGTGPAFLNIQQWIESRKIEEEEASEVIASMASAVRVPTEEYMNTFFELIKAPQVRNQEYLNETSLLSYTRLINRVYVNKNESQNQYPVHSFGSFNTKQGRTFVKSTVIPYLTQQLHDAVSQADFRKIHAYIRALGNIGHRKILEAFEPYLEGRKQVSQFQRMLMVLSLDKLVDSNPVVARSVLYRIYMNIAEIPEVRVVAVYQLMRTVPPFEMIQSMAENTNVEPEEQVNAAVKSAILSASQLTSEASEILRKYAQIARPLLTKKEYSNQQSLNFLQDFVVENMNMEFKHNLLQIGSADHTLPKGIKYTVRGNFNGMKNYIINIQAMTSSIKELTNVFYQQIQDDQKSKNQKSGEHQWSSFKIAESLNLQTNEREQLEGMIYGEMESLQRIWSFDNETIERLPQAIREKEQMLKNGKKFSYTKLKQLKEMALSLPTEMGMPFVYIYSMPLLVQFEGKIKGSATPKISRNDRLIKPTQMVGEIDAFVTISSKVQSYLSAVTPFDHQIYIAGFDKNFQAHVPIKAKVEADIKNYNAKIEFKVKEDYKDARLLHYSSWPFTSRSDIMSISPVALRPNTHRMRPESKTHRSFDFVLGQKETGISLRVWGHHPHQSLNLHELVNALKSEGIVNVWQQLWDKHSLQQTEASIAFIPEKSKTSKVVLRLGYQKQYQRQPENQEVEEFRNMDQLSSKAPLDLKKRQQDMLKYVGSGIKNAQLYSLEASMEFKADRTYEHILNFAAAKSNVAPQSRLVAFYQNNAENPKSLSLQIKGFIPNTNELDLTYSLKNAPKSKYEVLLQYGSNEEQSSKVRASVDLNRSKERRQYLEEKPLYQTCKKQMQEGNRHLYACQNMTIESNFFDDIKVELQHENFRKECADAIENIFKGIRFWYYPMTDIKTVQPEGQDKINVRVQFEPENLRQVNITLRAKDEETKMYNLSMGQFMKTVFVPHPVYHLKARVLGQIMGEDNIGKTCVLDNKSAQTFGNWTYPLSLGNDWTVMMMYVPQQARRRGQPRQQPVEQLRDQDENFVVLVRELSEEQKEVKITFNNPETKSKTVELIVKPKQKGSIPAASVLVDDKEVEFDDTESADLFNGYTEIYALPNGEVKVEIKDWFYIVFDGDRVKLTATSEKLRDSIVGICGRFSKDLYEDFWTPNNCMVKSPAKFVQSFVLQEEKQKQPQECVSKVLPLYVDVISDYDVERKESVEEISTDIKLRNRYIEENGNICFTTHPVPVCMNLARTYNIKDIPVHCVTKTKTAYYLKNQIDQGGNPDFTRKPVTKTMQMEIPDNCF